MHLLDSNHSTLASELAHGLHFSYLTTAKRETVQNDYLGFLVGQFIGGGATDHRLGAQTNPMVAFVEALDHFSSRFFKYAVDHPNESGSSLRNNFILSELNSGTFCSYSGSLNNGTVSNPVFTGSSDEGAVYAAIFLDFARRPGVGLKTAANAYFRSRKLTFGQYRTWIHNNKPVLANAIDGAAANFGL